jgi:G:T/U-mismatch repair DNA glycosylase
MEGTEILIIGTFNPDTPENDANFFYSRGRNHLWELVPKAFGDKPLMGASMKDKENYIKGKNIDFIDLIAEVDVKNPYKENDLYDDTYIDGKDIKWRVIESEIKKIRGSLKKVCFTRRTFDDVKKIEKRVDEVITYCGSNCKANGIYFKALRTPSNRKHDSAFIENRKNEWTEFFKPTR